MSDDAATPQPLTFNGSCHCAAIKFKVTLDPSNPTKCNCTICEKHGAIQKLVKEGDLQVVDENGAKTVITYNNFRDVKPAGLKTYSFSPPNKADHDIHHMFCDKCGIFVFLIGHLAMMGGNMICVNLRTLDFKAAGKDFKDYTKPEDTMYCDGLTNWASRKGEPYAGGAW